LELGPPEHAGLLVKHLQPPYFYGAGYSCCRQAGWCGEELEAYGEHGLTNAARKF